MQQQDEIKCTTSENHLQTNLMFYLNLTPFGKKSLLMLKNATNLLPTFKNRINSRKRIFCNTFSVLNLSTYIPNDMEWKDSCFSRSWHTLYFFLIYTLTHKWNLRIWIMQSRNDIRKVYIYHIVHLKKKKKRAGPISFTYCKYFSIPK